MDMHRTLDGVGFEHDVEFNIVGALLGGISSKAEAYISNPVIDV